MRIHLPNSAFLGNIENFINRFDPSDPDRLDVTMHEGWVAIHPVVLAMTAALGNDVARNGGEVTFEVHEVRSLPYLIRLGLFNYLGIDPPREIDEHEAAGRFIPLTTVTSGTELRDFLVDIIPLIHADPRHAESIRYVISELVRNVVEHAASPNGAIVCAQYFRKTGRLSVGVVDTGQGVMRSMSRSHRVRSAGEAIHLALQPGITGATMRFGGNEFNAGAGLFFVKSIAQASRNYFLLYSNDAMFKLRKAPLGSPLELHADPSGDISTERSGLSPWPGTVVGIDLSIEETIEFDELLEQIRLAYFRDVDGRRREFRQPRFE